MQLSRQLWPFLLGTSLLPPGCGVSRNEVLEGKSCGVAGQCSEGYHCDSLTQRCFLGDGELDGPEAMAPNDEEQGGASAGGASAGGTSSGGAPVAGSASNPDGGLGGSPDTPMEPSPTPPEEPDSGAPPAPPGPPEYDDGPFPILYYDFNAGPSAVIPDVSGKPPQVDLQVSKPEELSWMTGKVELKGDVMLSGIGDTRSLNRALKASNALSVELWLSPKDLGQSGPARILSLAAGIRDENFIIGQEDEELVRRYRASAGIDSWSVPGFVEEVMHLVLTRDEQGHERFYINGVIAAEQETSASFDSWDEGNALTVANDVGGERPWRGVFDTVALYDEALTHERLTFLFELGPR